MLVNSFQDLSAHEEAQEAQVPLDHRDLADLMVILVQGEIRGHKDKLDLQDQEDSLVILDQQDVQGQQV